MRPTESCHLADSGAYSAIRPPKNTNGSDATSCNHGQVTAVSGSDAVVVRSQAIPAMAIAATAHMQFMATVTYARLHEYSEYHMQYEYALAKLWAESRTKK